MWRDDQECDVFKFSKKMIKTNQNIIGEQCIRNYDDDVLTVCDEDKKIVGKVILRSFVTQNFHGIRIVVSVRYSWQHILRIRQRYNQRVNQ